MGSCIRFHQSETAEFKFELRPDRHGHAHPVAEQGAHDSGVGNHGKLRQIERGGKIQGARLQGRDRFSAGGSEIEHIIRPGVDFAASDFVPAFPFPCTKINLAQARIDADIGTQRLGQAAGTAQRAGKHGQTNGQSGPEPLGDRLRIKTIGIEAAIAYARFNQRAWMADQENLHSRPL